MEQVQEAVLIDRSDVIFESKGERCAGWLFAPAMPASRPMPCVVMAHGATGTMSLGLERYARRFAKSGCAVLTFDYRHFGGSDGEPRQLISVDRQLDDWRAAIRYARSLHDVDTERLALWGTSLGGGHVVELAAHDRDIAAVIAQLPFLGIDRHRSSSRRVGTTVQLFAAAVADSFRVRAGRPSRTVPMVGMPGSFAVFTGPGDFESVQRLSVDAPDWRNEMTARSLWSLIHYRPGRSAPHVQAPLMVCVAQEDAAASVRLAEQAAADGHAELHEYPGGHFAAYLPPVFDLMVADQTAFLEQHLHPTRPLRPPR